MNKRIACALALAWLALPALAQTQPEATQQAEDVPARIVVSGRRPGPGLWKVSKDGHVMWVFGVYSPLPKDMQWDAGRVERLLGESQAVLLPPSAEAKVGFLKGLSLLPQLPRLIGIQDNPDGAKLQDVLPADVYAHWTVLRAKYMEVKDSDADRKLERLRPIFVAQRLRRAGLDKNGLSLGGDVREQIIQMARKNKLKLTSTGFELPLDNVGKAITAFKETRLNDVACFSKTLDSLEQDIDAMQVRANAWANGNIAELQRLDFETLEDACDEAILGSSAAQANPEFRSMRERLRTTWLAAAEKSLLENASSFAILGMKDVFDRKGYLAALQAKGYTVESPK